MYVILKGSVAVEIKQPDIGNLPIIVALLKDGSHFGELGLIKMEDDKGAQFTNKRKASCITAEETDVLVLNKQLCTLLYQSSNQEKSESSSRLGSDKVQQKIKYL
jgi:CRP-like cAMP-binding protein